MSARYAANTNVSSTASRDEIERTLARYGATAFMYGWDQTAATIMFEVHAKAGMRRVRFRLPLPDRNDRAFTHTEVRGYRRDPKAQDEAYEQAVKQRWRALALVVKAKLEAVAAGITTFEDEFGMFIQLPNGQTVGEAVRPEINRAYELGEMRPMLAIGAHLATSPERD